MGLSTRDHGLAVLVVLGIALCRVAVDHLAVEELAL